MEGAKDAPTAAGLEGGARHQADQASPASLLADLGMAMNPVAAALCAAATAAAAAARNCMGLRRRGAWGKLRLYLRFMG